MTDTYQAVYDAVRSRISGLNTSMLISEIVAAFDISWQKAHLQQEITSVSHEMQRPAVLFKPKLYSITDDGSGEIWRARYDDFCVSGKTPYDAMQNFDKEWYGRK